MDIKKLFNMPLKLVFGIIFTCARANIHMHIDICIYISVSCDLASRIRSCRTVITTQPPPQEYYSARVSFNTRNEYTKLIYSYARDLCLRGRMCRAYYVEGLRKKTAPLASHIIFGAPLSRDRRINTDLSHL